MFCILDLTLMYDAFQYSEQIKSIKIKLTLMTSLRDRNREN